MLKGDFYTVLKKESGDEALCTNIRVKKDHPIFKGHFPGLPIVPGVCMIQIVREMMEGELRTALRLLSADNIKFLTVINPEETAEVTISLNYTNTPLGYEVRASIFSQAITYFKFKGVFAVK